MASLVAARTRVAACRLATALLPRQVCRICSLPPGRQMRTRCRVAQVSPRVPAPPLTSRRAQPIPILPCSPPPVAACDGAASSPRCVDPARWQRSRCLRAPLTAGDCRLRVTSPPLPTHRTPHNTPLAAPIGRRQQQRRLAVRLHGGELQDCEGGAGQVPQELQAGACACVAKAAPVLQRTAPQLTHRLHPRPSPPRPTHAVGHHPTARPGAAPVRQLPAAVSHEQGAAHRPSPVALLPRAVYPHARVLATPHSYTLHLHLLYLARRRWLRWSACRPCGCTRWRPSTPCSTGERAHVNPICEVAGTARCACSPHRVQLTNRVCPSFFPCCFPACSPQ
jgi:hypothetical protein